ncbi:MAG: acyltransferase [Blautia sp.]|nr:acyltransferase [Blautia sp.]
MRKKKQPVTYQILSKYRGVLMGVSIIFIILFHYLDDVRTSGTTFTAVQKWIYRYISSSNVDIFILVSSLGLYFSMKKNRNLLSFYKRRFTKILIPYLLIAVPAIYWRQVIFYQRGMRSFLEYLAVPLSVRWFWYIWLICFCYLIFPYVFDIFESAGDRIQEQMYLAGIFTAITVFAMLLKQYAPEVFDRYEVALLRLPWFFAGCMLGKASYEKRKINGGLLLFILFSFLLVPLREYGSQILTRYVLTGFNMSLCFLLVFFLYGLSGVNALSFIYRPVIFILELFGKYSLELYLTHVAIRRVMLEFKYPMQDIRYEAFMVILSMIVSFLLKPISGFLEKLIINLPFWKE